METKRTEITIRTSRLLVTNKVKSMTAWCELCGKQSHWLTVDDTALLLGLTSRMIFRQTEAGALHSLETREGLLLVCLDSLGGEANSPDPQIRQIEEDSDRGLSLDQPHSKKEKNFCQENESCIDIESIE